MLSAFLSIAGMTYLFVQMDQLIRSRGFVKPYYATHVLHNAAMVALTSRDVYYSFTDFGNVFTYPVNWTAVYLCYALHLYHCILYWRSFHFDDWLHHILMVAIALPIGSLVPSGTLMGFSLFFTTGLPGGINYALLFAERNGWVTRVTEKRINRPIHVWMRSPGCVAHATLTLAASLSNSQAESWHRTVACLIALLTYWNGQYFMEQMVVSSVRAPSNTERGVQAGVSSMVPIPSDAATTAAHPHEL
jgi:hypothetical protein